jgi:hypothetical protein
MAARGACSSTIHRRGASRLRGGLWASESVSSWPTARGTWIPGRESWRPGAAAHGRGACRAWTAPRLCDPLRLHAPGRAAPELQLGKHQSAFVGLDHPVASYWDTSRTRSTDDGSVRVCAGTCGSLRVCAGLCGAVRVWLSGVRRRGRGPYAGGARAGAAGHLGHARRGGAGERLPYRGCALWERGRAAYPANAWRRKLLRRRVRQREHGCPLL